MYKKVGVSQACRFAMMCLDRVGAYTGQSSYDAAGNRTELQASKYITGKGLATLMGVKWSTAWRKRMVALETLNLVEIGRMQGAYWYRLTIHGQSEIDLRAIDACEYETWTTGSFEVVCSQWDAQNA